ncbi:Autoinducer 2-binding protein LsrB [Caprobacter fermentans]|uniref:Autoinducer 2-binding protein LsrB n=1 Tax=Caproicibacter fermentans TaxID=2576756 RepID=A0A6N8I3U2_9FIRM|nr:substrate-binding domain-containing protein [Caproicibacter fermentans]MVB12702.1 Autoinducer 2-binding protein LsrB [Caproicibacter fermentans]
MKKVLALALAASIMATSLAGCGGNGGSSGSAAESKASSGASAAAGDKSVKGKTVVFIPKLTGNAFFESANAGAQEYSKQWGFTVDYQGSPNAAVADEVQVVNNAIASGADAICISSVDATGLDSALKKAKDAGMTVVTWDSDVSTDARALMVSQGTPDILGKMLVDMSADSLTKRGKDVAKDAIKYCWHYSQATVADQNSWQAAGEKYIKEKYPNWVNVAPDNYYSEQDAEKAVSVGASILEAHKDIDLIVCNDSTALPGQCKAAQNAGLTKKDITITGFASPNSIRDYCKANVIEQWGLWDCGIQGAMGCYLAAYLAAGNTVKVGDKINIPSIGEVEVMPNDSLVPGAKTTDTNNGVVLLPERVVFNASNVDKYNF